MHFAFNKVLSDFRDDREKPIETTPFKYLKFHAMYQKMYEYHNIMLGSYKHAFKLYQSDMINPYALNYYKSHRNPINRYTEVPSAKLKMSKTISKSRKSMVPSLLSGARLKYNISTIILSEYKYINNRR